MYVYKITNLTNGKSYVGQTVRADNRRLNIHRYMLNKGTHSNKHLQSAWNKYGKVSFVFEKVAFAKSIPELDALEKQIIESCKADNREFGYNIFNGGHHQHSVPIETRQKIGGANRGNTHTTKQKKKWAKEKRTNTYAPYVISPTGKRYKVTNIREFARTHGIDKGNLMQLLKGNVWHVKGWRLPETPVEYTKSGYATFKAQSKLVGKKLRGPDGETYVIDKPLTEFCKEHNLRATKLRLVIQGKQKYHRGWYKI